MKRMLVVVICALSLSGCAAAVVGGAAGVAAGWVYVNGTLKDVLSVPLPDAEAAVRAAAVELELSAVDGGIDGLEAKLRARMADGTRVRIVLKAVDFETTAVHVRVGKLGNSAISQQILRHIKAQLEES